MLRLRQARAWNSQAPARKLRDAKRPCSTELPGGGGSGGCDRESPQQKRQRIAELEERARLFGDSAKQSAQGRVLERKWLRFLLVHGEEYSFTPRKGPTVALVEHFTTYCFCTRDTVSVIGRVGLGDSFELQIRCAPRCRTNAGRAPQANTVRTTARYMLAKFVFVALKYNGWRGLDAYALHAKAEPFKFAVRELWQRLKQSDPDATSTLKPFVKTKWCDTTYFLAQVRVAPCSNRVQ